MTDATTTVLAFVKQEVGAKRNTWGASLNSTLDLIEEAICGRTSVSTTGGGTTLTQAQARKRFIDVSGALVSDATITVPNATKDWIITNSTSGSFAVLVKTSGGTATSVPQGTRKNIACDGSNGVTRDDITEVGQMAFFGTTAVPAGWWECTGTTKSRAGEGIDLFAKASTTWGVGNGATTFGLPDAYTAGKFLRSRTASVALATAQGDQNKAHTHALTAASAAANGGFTPSGTIGNNTAFTMSGTTSTVNHDHTHTVPFAATGNTATLSGSNTNQSFVNANLTTTSSIQSQDHTHTVTVSQDSAHIHTFTGNAVSAHTHTLSGTTDSDGGTEARPTNLSAILCIKY